MVVTNINLCRNGLVVKKVGRVGSTISVVELISHSSSSNLIMSPTGLDVTDVDVTAHRPDQMGPQASLPGQIRLLALAP